MRRITGPRDRAWVEAIQEGIRRSADAGLAPRQQVDEIAVIRAVSGDAPTVMNIAERIEATRLLDRRGISAAEVARILRVSERSVVRYRAKGRAA